MDILKIISKIYDNNPVSYNILRNFQQNQSFSNLFNTLIILPVIPIWNYFAKKEIHTIHRNNSIYKVRGKKETIFFLPDLNLQKGEFIQNRIFLERGYFERRHLKRVRTYLEKSETIIDIGANIGNHSLYFVNECNVKKSICF